MKLEDWDLTLLSNGDLAQSPAPTIADIVKTIDELNLKAAQSLAVPFDYLMKSDPSQSDRDAFGLRLRAFEVDMRFASQIAEREILGLMFRPPRTAQWRRLSRARVTFGP